MDEQFIIQSISTIGFPVAMSMYLITRMEKTIKDLTLAVNSLVVASNRGDN